MRLTLDGVTKERDAAQLELSALKASGEEREKAFEARLAELREAKETLTAQFSEVGSKLLGEAQKAFLDRANERFKQSEELSGKELKALLQPVSDRLKRYEEGVAKIEAERRDAFGDLKGQIEQMRVGQEKVSSEAAKLVNSLRNAPKSRGRWGEQQLRNVLETCGLSEHADFQTEVSIETDDGGRLQPDVVVRVPGGRSLVIDAKVSLNAYQDAFDAVDDEDREAGLAAHTASLRNHINSLGNKAYWSQFDDAPDYVIMFVPGEHFLSAALEHDPTLWDFAFEKRVLLATPTNLIAIAKTVAAVWRQEKLAGQAREIANLGKDLHSRIFSMTKHIVKLGKNLDTTVGAYNSFVGSLESQVLSQARRFESLEVSDGAKSIDDMPVVESSSRALSRLAIPADASCDN
ncbi:MAG: DNA recombination protein RmuC [Sphingomonadaceae bacterium]|nr:DNA recombination protein RmuC [Sphingomonadaceae bacterium]